MKITSVHFENVRGYLNTSIYFSQNLNVFIGPNNSGKSTILNSIYHLQSDILSKKDITIGYNNGTILLAYEGSHLHLIPEMPRFRGVRFDLGSATRTLEGQNGIGSKKIDKLPTREPLNLIYPFLSKRKAARYDSAINAQTTNEIHPDLRGIFARVDQHVTTQFDGNQYYLDACRSILGFEMSTIASSGGKEAAYYIDGLKHIPLTSMGEGVVNIIGLITYLSTAKNKIFLIEEIENDIHPKALKILLNLIIDKSQTNQFFVSTHSNIVMRYLGGVENSKVYLVNNNSNHLDTPKLFVSSITELKDSSQRQQALEELGYDHLDFNLWKGWLFLEESSAETIIRDYLIDWFVKPLKYKLKTFSANGVSQIEPKFEDFNRLFVFLHLQPSYKNKVWVIIDSGDAEEKIIETMRDKYGRAGWNPENFCQFKHHDFEHYYPSIFKVDVDKILSTQNSLEKRQLKKNLLEKIKEWISENENEARNEFKKSAAEVIDKLKKINIAL